VNKAFSVREQLGAAEKLAVTLTAAPSATSPVSVTLCGLVPIANVCPFTTRLPVAGGFAYVTTTTCVYVFVAGSQAVCAPAARSLIAHGDTAQLAGAVNSAFSVREQLGAAEKLAVTLTGAPSATSP